MFSLEVPEKLRVPGCLGAWVKEEPHHHESGKFLRNAGVTGHIHYVTTLTLGERPALRAPMW